MNHLFQKRTVIRTGALYLALAVFFAGVPLDSVLAAPSVDIKANGSDGPVTITAGDPFSYSWTTSGATACQLTDPDGNESGQDVSGTGGPIPSDHPWYPSIGNPSTLTLDCTDGIESVSDSVIIQIAEDEEPEPEIVTVDIKANGSDGPVTITQGDSWVYSWTSGNATACQLTDPDGNESGQDVSGTGGPIPADHPWYPSIGNPSTLTLDCTNGIDSVSDFVVINVVAGPAPVVVTADIKANGSDGPVTITQGDSWVYSWTSGNATACQLTDPDGNESGVDLNNPNAGPIPADHPWYPSIGNPSTLTLDCTNGTDNASDFVVINVVEDDDDGGGGGDDDDDDDGDGRSRSRSRASVQPGEVLGAATVSNFCPYITTFMRIGANNDTMQVIRLQAFLKGYEKFDYVTINGVFDAATHQAVNEFQLRYKSEILTPWGISQPTGYVYKLTLAKINNILCGSPMPHVTPAKVIKDKKPAVLGKEAAGFKEGVGKEGSGTTTSASIPLIGKTVSQGEGSPQGQISGQEERYLPNGLAAALFTWPSSGTEVMKTLYQLLLILIVLYILGAVLQNVLYNDTPENVHKRFVAKWTTITVGLALAWAGAFFLQAWLLLFPLMVAFVISLIWLLTRSRHDTVKASAKNWYMDSSAKAKSMLKETPKETTTQTVTVTEKK